MAGAMGRVHDDEVETKSRVALRTRWRSVALILHDAGGQSGPPSTSPGT
jgi:hypothetical protein